MQHDLKKVIAYSTCSQLGYMVFACGLSFYSVSMFHLINHAFFKALLFLSAGSVIHTVHVQEMPQMGGLKKKMPYTFLAMLLCTLAIAGIPFFSGFVSKDRILGDALVMATHDSLYAIPTLLGFMGAFLTAFYSMRLTYLTFLANPNGYKHVISKAYDSSYAIITPLFLLTIPSIFIGYYTKDMIIGLGTDFWGNSIYVWPSNMNRIDSEFISQIWKLLPVIFSLLGTISAYILYTIGNKFLYKLKISFLGKKIILIYPVPEVGKNVPNFTTKQRMINNNDFLIKTPYRNFINRNFYSILAFDKAKFQENIKRVYPSKIFCDEIENNLCIS